MSSNDDQRKPADATRAPADDTGRDETDDKSRDLEPHRERAAGEFLTTNQGTRVEHTDDSLKAGPRGPTLLEDLHFREKMMHFDHERIPERVVHARGSAAHGYFQVYRPLAEWTKASFLQDPDRKTPVFVRFSTVVGFRGSADTVRDVRGFATKFYTDDGNYDLVGNNMPVFFIQDAIKFPDLVHAIKPEPHHEMPQASAAHDTFWDFISLQPEASHIIMWVLSDRALPRSYRMMEGFGVHTFRFVNAQGRGRFVKFHWRPALGTASLVWDEAQKLQGKDPDFNRRDLWEAIDAGDFPEFELGVQVIDEADEHRFDFDLLDPTKLVPESEVPVELIGKMTLNRNPDNFFAETEQVAFHPGHVVPGIDVTNDPLLQGRLFSYLDTQLIRLGGPNFSELPINRPLAPVHNNQRDGYGRQTINRGRTAYSPNSLADGDPRPAPEEQGGYVHYAEKVEGHKVRARSESFGDHFSQAAMFWHSITEAEQAHLVSAAHFELGKVESAAVRKRMVHDIFNKIDHGLAVRVAEGIGVEPPTTLEGPRVEKRAPEVGVEARKRTDTIATRKIAILAADGYDHRSLHAVRAALERRGARSEVVSEHQGRLRGEGGEVAVDKSYVVTASIMYDAVLVAGGRASVETLMRQGDALHFINEAYRHGKTIGALGEGAVLLAASQIGDVAVSDSAEPVVDAGVVTLADAAADERVTAFEERFAETVAQHRHWGRGDARHVPA